MLHEIARKAIHTIKNEEVILSWHNNLLTVRTDKGIQIYDFSYNLNCMDKDIDLSVSYVPNSKSSPATGMFPSEYMKSRMNNIELTQMIVEPGFWPHNPELTQEMANVVTFAWSPTGIIYNNEYTLAVLNNVGNVEFLGPLRYQWVTILDLSSIIKEDYEDSQVLKAPDSFEEVKTGVEAVESSAICWGSKVDELSYNFVTGQRNGNLLFWLIQAQEDKLTATFQGKIQTDLGEIISMLWIPKKNNNFVLICSNVFGQIYAFACEFNNAVKLIKVIGLWTYQDRMIAKYLLYTVVDDKIILMCNKHRHLLVLFIDKDCNLLSQVVTNVNDHRITDIKKSVEGFYLTTVNCKLYKINCASDTDSLNVNLSLVDVKDEYSTYELYNFCNSTNGVMWAFAMVDRKIMCRKILDKIDIVFLSTSILFQPTLSLLLNNPTRKLMNFWDCIELLRFQVMKLKSLPPIDYNQMYVEANSDMYKLQLYLIFVILYNCLEKMLKNSSKGLLPETSAEVVREKILTKLASQHITDLYNTGKNGKLNNFELESFIASRKYLEYFCTRNNRNIHEYVESNILNSMKTDRQYTCQSCDEAIIGLSCKNGHLNTFCPISFTAIENDEYIVCKCCSSVARIELYGSKPMCPFCGLYLNSYNLL